MRGKEGHVLRDRTVLWRSAAPVKIGGLQLSRESSIKSRGGVKTALPGSAHLGAGADREHR